jgi:hypothetical protein
MPHVVLLGDSIFDNAAYVAGGPDVIRQLRPKLPEGWRATLLAVDGAVTSGVPNQLARLPSDASHLAISVGGNDALRHSGLLAAVCTIYDPRFPDTLQRRLAATALSTFNDRITRAAFSRGLPLIDLRLLCNEDRDFANPIEPSVQGGDKLSGAIARLVTTHDFSAGRSVVIAR